MVEEVGEIPHVRRRMRLVVHGQPRPLGSTETFLSFSAQLSINVFVTNSLLRQKSIMIFQITALHRVSTHLAFVFLSFGFLTDSNSRELQFAVAAMAVMMTSMSVVAGVQADRDVVSTRSQGHLGSATRGLRLHVAGTRSCVPLRSSLRRSIVVVCAEEDVTKKVQNAVDGAASKVKETAGAAKSKLEHAEDAAGVRPLTM